MHITDTRNPQVHFGGFSSYVSQVVLEMAFIKNYENFEELQNRLGNFRCLLYAQHVNINIITIVLLLLSKKKLLFRFTQVGCDFHYFKKRNKKNMKFVEE